MWDKIPNFVFKFNVAGFPTKFIIDPEGKILNNSARDGQWLFYNETGILSGDALYKNGLKVGTWHYFDAATGKEVRSEEYNNDLLIQTK